MKTQLNLSAAILLSVFTLQAQQLNWQQYNQENSPLLSNTIHDILLGERGTWIGTENGLGLFNGTDWQIFTTENSELPDNHVYDLCKDNWGNIWVATDQGVVKITTTTWQVFDVNNSPLPTNLIRSVATDSEGNLWVGTWGQGVVKNTGTQWRLYNTSNSGVPSNGIYTVEVDTDGHLWVGTYNGGVSMYNGVSWNSYNTTNSPLPHNNVRSITFDAQNAVWFGTEDGIAVKSDIDSWHIYNYQNLGYSIHMVLDGVQESAGKIFFATDGGLVCIHPTEFNVLTVQNSQLPSNHIRSIAQTEEGNLWLGTGNKGVAVYSPHGLLSTQNATHQSPTFTVYPNPARTQLSLHLDQFNSSKIALEIRNTLGQQIVSYAITNTGMYPTTIPVAHLPSGVYHLILHSGNETHSQKFYKL